MEQPDVHPRRDGGAHPGQGLLHYSGGGWGVEGEMDIEILSTLEIFPNRLSRERLPVRTVTPSCGTQAAGALSGLH